MIWYKYKNTSTVHQQYINQMIYHLQKSIDPRSYIHQQILVQKPNVHQSRPSSKSCGWDCLGFSGPALPSCWLNKPFWASSYTDLNREASEKEGVSTLSVGEIARREPTVHRRKANCQSLRLITYPWRIRGDSTNKCSGFSASPA